ncbi:hypothetical protein KCH_12570 [Kitasatospora cheerisanensis KCTC 2395]|uniref:Uncharacterized protein n=1 Tax=Kitasatospora cheerisanensis KCTC 2395 TaxID=1348663 RepID=A0A066Z148_9ACTN|nr:hypothetical protein KCH_12570 [Kitasatospora cheerisanensis KCTC 2395]
MPRNDQHPAEEPNLTDRRTLLRTGLATGATAAVALAGAAGRPTPPTPPTPPRPPTG